LNFSLQRILISDNIQLNDTKIAFILKQLVVIMKKQINPSPLTKRLLTEFGENIRLARLRRNLPIRVMAERVGVSVNTITALEKGMVGVSIGIVANVLHALGLAEDLKSLAKDDVLGRKLQDMKLLPRKKAPKKKYSGEINE
jgi:transcriptional regulator with XRE-family HTH domain